MAEVSRELRITGELVVTFVDEELVRAVREGEEALRELCEVRALTAVRGELLGLIERRPG